MVNELRNKENKASFIEKLKKYSKMIPDIENFVLIGEKQVELDGMKKFYNIHMRYNSTFDSEKVDFVFNDNTQAREIQNAETKYKTLFFSKVAHEFKNPLICITELLDQLNDSELTSENRHEIISQIKSLSSFMLVLVKDLNYFSEFNIGKETVIEEKEVDLDSLLKFCEDVTLGLMRKLNRPGVKLKFEKQSNLKTIISDEWRLRQILLNLLSNSVKFTYQGEVLVKIYTEGTSLIFNVIDTGIGIKEENKQKLFKPFSMETMNQNDMGSGLGLFIVKEISSKLGGDLNFQSEYSKGSNFTLTLPNKNPINEYKESPLSEKSVLVPLKTESGNIINLGNDSFKTANLEFLPGNFKQLNSIIFENTDIYKSLYQEKSPSIYF
jgi:signal transduction histidine kinase